MRLRFTVSILAAIAWQGHGQSKPAAVDVHQSEHGDTSIPRLPARAGRSVDVQRSTSSPSGVRLRVGLRVIDQAAVPDNVLRRGREVVSHILGQAGAEAVWLDCPLGEQDAETRRLCNQMLGKSDFWLHLAVRTLPGSDHDTLGSALLDPAANSVAYVYYPRIETFAKDLQCDTSLVLAVAIAHEIGHLLLGASAHSRTGIMSARLSPRDLELAKKGSLVFTQDQARLIRVQISALGKPPMV